MKLKYIIIGLLLGFLYSCEDGDSVDISSVTIFPLLEFEESVAVEVGEQFTPFATAKEGETDLEVGIDSNVDNTEIGVYSVNYSAENTEGYSKVGTQTVVVHDPSIVGTDVSGVVMDKGTNTRTGVISLVEGTSNIYYCTDFAFAGVFPLYFMMDGDNMVVIEQAFVFGVTSVDATYNAVAKEFSITVNPQGFSYNFQYQ
jgi:hypothetical protein